jgi:hypothetical protein
MGLMKLFSKTAPALVRLPSGSFTVDRGGHVLVATLPSAFPTPVIHDIARQVLETFRDAQTAQLPLSELIINYPGLRISARELRGGAIVFLSPKALASAAP